MKRHERNLNSASLSKLFSQVQKERRRILLEKKNHDKAPLFDFNDKFDWNVDWFQKKGSHETLENKFINVPNSIDSDSINVNNNSLEDLRFPSLKSNNYNNSNNNDLYQNFQFFEILNYKENETLNWNPIFQENSNRVTFEEFTQLNEFNESKNHERNSIDNNNSIFNIKYNTDDDIQFTENNSNMNQSDKSMNNFKELFGKLNVDIIESFLGSSLESQSSMNDFDPSSIFHSSQGDHNEYDYIQNHDYFFKFNATPEHCIFVPMKEINTLISTLGNLDYDPTTKILKEKKRKYYISKNKDKPVHHIVPLKSSYKETEHMSLGIRRLVALFKKMTTNDYSHKQM